MKEFTIEAKQWNKQFLLGTSMIMISAVWAREAYVAQPRQWGEAALFAFCALAGARVLSRSFFAVIKAQEDRLLLRQSVWPAKHIPYEDIVGVAYDTIQNRVTLWLKQGKKIIFAYVYEDVQGFLQLLGNQCRNLKGGIRNE